MTQGATFRASNERCRGRWLSRRRVAQILAALAVSSACLHLALGPKLTIQVGQRPLPSEDEHIPLIHATPWECMHPGSCVSVDNYGASNFSYGPSRGYYPAGCRWRDVNFEDGRAVAYEYWDEESRAWTLKRPHSCTLQAEEVPSGYVWNKSSNKDVALDTPATAVEPKDTHVLMKNLWYNNGKWYALVERGSKFVPNIKISRNQQITCLHVKNATAWAANTRHLLVRKDTLLFDYIYFLHPTAIGHWMEMMFPLFSILKASSFQPPDVNVILLHLKRAHLIEWARAVMATTLGVKAREHLPPILMQEETEVHTEQTAQPLEGVPAAVWIAFETVMIVRDLFTGGKRSFASTADARVFREKIYRNHGLVLPSHKPGAPIPQVITYQRKRANRRIENESEVLELLRMYAPVNVVEFNASHSVQEQISTMSKTGVFVSVHTSNLANSVFLPPGSAVVELIQRFWTWMDLDKSFKDQTDQLADVHHFAWRAYHTNQTIYLNPRDRDRFGNWTLAQCRVQECVEAHTNVDIIVDVDQLKAMLDARLPLVLAGAPVTQVRSVWPAHAAEGPQPWTTLPGKV